LVGWLADTQHTLKKLAFIVDHVPPDQIKLKRLHLNLESPHVGEYDFRPDLLRFLRTGRV